MFNVYRVSVWDGENFLEMDNSDGCTVIDYIPCHSTVYLEMVKIISLTLCIFYYNKLQ